MKRHPCIVTTQQHGQSLPFALLALAVAGLAFVALYNVGQVVAARMRLTHATDAAAYSGAVVQARALNMLALIHRTQIAHQVAMAHLTTLGAWAQFGQHQAQRRLGQNPPAALIAAFFGLSHGRAYAGARRGALSGELGDIDAALARHDQLVHGLLSPLETRINQRLPEVRWQAMRAVLQANYPELPRPQRWDGYATPNQTLVMRVDDDHWSGWLSRYAGNQGAHLRPMVTAATQGFGFLAPRDHSAWHFSVSHGPCVWLPAQLRRRGKTWLDPHGRWRAVDTQSFHAVRANRWVGCYWREYPMGWGLVTGRTGQAGEDLDYIENAPQRFSHQAFWRWVKEATTWSLLGIANPLATSYGVFSGHRFSGRGLAPYWDIAAGNEGKPPGFTLEVRLPATRIATTDEASQVKAPRGIFQWHGLAKQGGLQVRSAARSVFVSPLDRQATGKGDLFQPYWQARLVAPLVSPLSAPVAAPLAAFPVAPPLTPYRSEQHGRAR